MAARSQHASGTHATYREGGAVRSSLDAIQQKKIPQRCNRRAAAHGPLPPVTTVTTVSLLVAQFIASQRPFMAFVNGPEADTSDKVRISASSSIFNYFQTAAYYVLKLSPRVG
jgi:hypothetical protein